MLDIIKDKISIVLEKKLLSTVYIISIIIMFIIFNFQFLIDLYFAFSNQNKMEITSIINNFSLNWVKFFIYPLLITLIFISFELILTIVKYFCILFISKIKNINNLPNRNKVYKKTDSKQLNIFNFADFSFGYINYLDDEYITNYKENIKLYKNSKTQYNFEIPKGKYFSIHLVLTHKLNGNTRLACYHNDSLPHFYEKGQDMFDFGSEEIEKFQDIKVKFAIVETNESKAYHQKGHIIKTLEEITFNINVI